jgi:uridine kinase
VAALTPYFVGIAGGSGSGKTTIARRLISGLPTGSAVLIEHDAYYRDRSGMPRHERDALNFDHPDALDNALLVQHLTALSLGQSAESPLYDFVSHARRPHTRRIDATPVIIVEGILILADAALRERFDMKIYIDTDADIRAFRRLHRDMQTRGRTFAQVSAQYHGTVRPMHLEFVEPSKRFADIIIPEGGENHVALDLVTSKLMRLAADATAQG